MARSLQNKTNVDAPDSDYPYGRIRNNPGDGSGTPVNEAVYGDFHQFFERLMAAAGVVHNELPDNDYSGFQYFEALLKLFPDTLQFIIDGGGATITTGSKGVLVVPFKCTVVGWTILSKTTGSIVVDINKSDYAGFDTLSSIAGTEKPTLSAAKKNQDNDLDTWTADLEKGDILEFEVDSVTTVDRVTVVLNVERRF